MLFSRIYSEHTHRTTNRLSEVCFLPYFPFVGSDRQLLWPQGEANYSLHVSLSIPLPTLEEEQVLFREMSIRREVALCRGRRAKSARRGARDWLPILYGCMGEANVPFTWANSGVNVAEKPTIQFNTYL